MGCKRLQPSARRLKQKDYLHGNTWQRPLLASGYEIQKCEWTWASPSFFAQVSTLHLYEAPQWLLLPDSMRGNTEAIINLAGKVVTGMEKDLYRTCDSSSRRWRREHIGEKKRRALGTHFSSTQLLSFNGMLACPQIYKSRLRSRNEPIISIEPMFFMLVGGMWWYEGCVLSGTGIHTDLGSLPTNTARSPNGRNLEWLRTPVGRELEGGAREKHT